MKVILLFSFLLAAGCNVMPEKNISEQDEYSIRAFAVVQAVVNGDYEEFARNAGENEKQADAEEFRRSRENLIREFGTIRGSRFLGELQTPLLSNRIYAISFEKTDQRGKKILHEQLFQLIFGKQDERIRLLGMRFI